MAANGAGCLLAISALLGLGACGTAPQTRLHSLLPAPASGAAATRVTAVPSLGWELLSVAVPAQVDQPQWLVRRADDSLVALEFERWAAPLGDEIRGALVQHISQALAATPIGGAWANQTWRISVEVTRLDAALGRRSHWDATWALQGLGAQTPALRCRGQFDQPAAGGLAAMAEAHRANVAKLGEVLAADLRRVAVLPASARAQCAAP